MNLLYFSQMKVTNLVGLKSSLEIIRRQVSLMQKKLKEQPSQAFISVIMEAEQLHSL